MVIGTLGGVALAPVRLRLDADDRDPEAAQARVLALQARALRDTEVAKLQDPRIWASPAAWRRHVRRTGAVHYAALVEEGLANPRPGMFEAAATLQFGRSCSGRAVPYTRSHRRAFDGLQVALLTAAARVADVTLGPILLMQGGLGVQRTQAGVVHGYSASLALDTMPWPMSAIIAPTPASMRGLDDVARLAAVRQALLVRRPRALTGVPSGVVAAIRALLVDDDGEVASALSRIRVYGWSGMPLGPYEAVLRGWFAPGCELLDVASSTEGPIGWPDPDGLRLGWGLGMFGFVAPGDDRIVGPADLVPGRWELVIGSGAGWQGFSGGDVIEVRSTKPVRGRLLPRGIDVEALGAAVGHDRFRVFMDDLGHELITEGVPGDLAAVAKILGGAPRHTAVADGAIDAAALAVAKLPWVFRDPALRARIVGS